jgi:hypothetical protein
LCIHKPIIRKLFVTRGIVESLQENLNKTRTARIDILCLDAVVAIFREGLALSLQETGYPDRPVFRAQDINT